MYRAHLHFLIMMDSVVFNLCALAMGGQLERSHTGG